MQSFTTVNGDEEGERHSYVYSNEPDHYSGSSNAEPSIIFGPVEQGHGSLSIYAAVALDTTVRIEADIHQPCKDAPDCASCLRTVDGTKTDSQDEDLCVWTDPTAKDTDRCQTRTAWMAKGLKRDHSCQHHWGLDMFTRLQAGWQCGGETSTHAATRDNPSTELSLEECAEECHLANVAWTGWSGPAHWGSIGSTRKILAGLEGYDCEGFEYHEESGSCRLLSQVQPALRTAWSGGNAGTKCYVSKENVNPCGFVEGEWVRHIDSTFYYIGDESLLYNLKMKDGAVPKCGGVSVFGDGRELPKEYCNGYGMESDGDAPGFDRMCSTCLDHMLQHQLLVGPIGDGLAGCDAMNTKVARVCQGDDVELACPRGTIDLTETTMAATYGRLESRYCSKAPAGLVVDSMCGSRGNVADIVKSQCQGSSTCTFTAEDESLGDQGCSHVFKYFNVMYRCTGSSN